MSGTIEPLPDMTAEDAIDVEEPREKSGGQHGMLIDKEAMDNAFKGEDLEHSMGAWEAAKSHPKACFWAFFMCFTIVSPQYPYLVGPLGHRHLYHS